MVPVAASTLFSMKVSSPRAGCLRPALLRVHVRRLWIDAR
jgi:hypothetical protein